MVKSVPDRISDLADEILVWCVYVENSCLRSGCFGEVFVKWGY